MPTSRDKSAPLITEGLIIREYNGVGEADRFITVLTAEKGVVRAAARGARRIKSRSGSATGLLTYSRLRLIFGRDTYVVEDAQPIETFFSLREDIERISLAQYFCELAAALCPADEPAREQLGLLLRGLHHLANNSRPASLLKAVTEWRLLSDAGYMPDLQACAVCGGRNATCFSTLEGQIYCREHAPSGAYPLSEGALAAIRHVLSCPFEKCFSFSLAEPSLSQFTGIAEAFLKAQLNREFKTLNFYHTLIQTR